MAVSMPALKGGPRPKPRTRPTLPSLGHLGHLDYWDSQTRPESKRCKKKVPPSVNLTEAYWIYLIYSLLESLGQFGTTVSTLLHISTNDQVTQGIRRVLEQMSHLLCAWYALELPHGHKFAFKIKSFCSAGFGTLVPTSSKHFATLVRMVISSLYSLCSNRLYSFLLLHVHETWWNIITYTLRQHEKLWKTCVFPKGLNRGFNHKWGNPTRCMAQAHHRWQWRPAPWKQTATGAKGIPMATDLDGNRHSSILRIAWRNPWDSVRMCT